MLQRSQRWWFKCFCVSTAEVTRSSETVAHRTGNNASCAAPVAGNVVKIPRPGAIPKPSATRFCVPIRSAAVCGDFNGPLASPPPRSPSGSKKVQSLPPLSVTVVEPPQASGVPPVLECDEVWSDVGRKATPVWLWVAFAPHSGQIVAYALGDRTEATARQLWDRLPASYCEAEVYTDSWEPYAAVIPMNPHRPCPKSAGRTLEQDLMAAPGALYPQIDPHA